MEENRREIKFKGRTKYDKTWVTGYLVVDNDIYYIYSKEKIYPNIICMIIHCLVYQMWA